MNPPRLLQSVARCRTWSKFSYPESHRIYHPEPTAKDLVFLLTKTARCFAGAQPAMF